MYPSHRGNDVCVNSSVVKVLENRKEEINISHSEGSPEPL